MTSRTASVARDTLETRISVTVDLDGTGKSDLVTGLPFLEHMLDQVARHGMLGQAVAQAVGDKKGIQRYGHAYVPLDEALTRVVIDFSGRPGLVFDVEFTRPRVGDFDVDLFREFFHGFANHALVTLHVDNLRGDNAHHQAETAFKAFGRALRMAVAPDLRLGDATPSTKGVL
jgi:imidazoleglycerol-phosphate dehydratase